MSFEEEGVRVILSGQVVQCDYVAPGGEEDFYSLMLVVDGDEEYILEPGREADKLDEFIDRWVEVKGEMFETDEGNFLVVHEFDPDDEALSYDTDW
jgi:hypothetical protein